MTSSGGAWRRLLAVVLAGLAAAGAPTAALGAVLEVAPGVDHRELRAHVEVLRTPETLSLGEVQRRASDFEGLQGQASFGLTADTVWLRFTLTAAPTAAGAYILEIQYPHLRHVTVFQPGVSGRLRRQQVTREHPFGHRPIQSRYPTFPIELAAGEPRTVYVRAHTKGSLKVPLHLWREAAYHAGTQHRAYLLGGYYGILGGLVLYNLLVFLAFRDRNYLYYVLATANIGVFAFAFNGLGFQYLWPNAPRLDALLVLALGAATVVTVVQFARRFLELHRALPRLDRGAQALQLLGAATTVAAFLAPYRAVVLALIGLTLITVVAILAVGGYLLVAGLKQARFFMLGWTFYLVGATINSLNVSGLLPANLFTDYALQGGSAIEMILLSFALADRLRIMRDETERALEARVAERTSELDDALQRLRQANEVLREQSLSDSLTGLPNRRYFDAALERAWLTAAHERKPMAVLIADIDRFKPINDRHGHGVGDEVLCAVAEALRGAVNRSHDVIARYGGEEFAALLPDSDGDGAWAVAERIRKAAASMDSPVPVTVSVGVFAAWPETSESGSEDAIAMADAALYRAKQAGRNQVAGTVGH